MIDETEIITGERIQVRCGTFIGKSGQFNANPLIRKAYHDRKRLPRSHHAPIESRAVFVYGGSIDLIPKFRFSQNVSVYMHNSDHHLTAQNKRFFSDPKIRRVYAQNLTIPADEKFRPLPIGIANSMWPHGDTVLLHELMCDLPEKVNDFFFNFSVNTNRRERVKCKAVMEKKGLSFLPKMSQQEYLRSLASHKYCISPPGNGVDCHRVWECLYLGVIPICIDSQFTRNLIAEGFPIVTVPDWESLDMESVLDGYEPPSIPWEKLKVSYYINSDSK